jgi:hypothetical protein
VNFVSPIIHSEYSILENSQDKIYKSVCLSPGLGGDAQDFGDVSAEDLFLLCFGQVQFLD